MKNALILTGPTATGKTSFGVKLARKLGAEIVSADSRQVYKGLDIGSGKDIAEYTMPDGFTIPTHLLDIVDPAKVTYSLADFMLDAEKAMADIDQRNSIPLVIGGTALWIHSLLSRYDLKGGAPDPQLREQLRALSLPQLREILRTLAGGDHDILRHEPNNRTRLIRQIEMIKHGTGMTDKEIQLNETENARQYLLMGVIRSRSEVRRNIEIRLDERLEQGMLKEAVYLHDEMGVSWETLEFFGLEYQYMALHLQGKISFDEMRDTLLNKIRQFAKRQDSWFRKMEREGYTIYWFRPDQVDDAENLCRRFLAGEELEEPALKLADIDWGK